MAHYYNKICHLHPTAINDEDFRLEDDGTGVKIKNWNTSKLGAEPTLASIDAQIGDAKIEAKMMWKKIRKERNQLLKDSDYTMLKDYPTTVSEQEWTTYRQSLRDIPQTFSNPDDVTYPDKPE
jgi:hypothetical protein